MKIASLVCLVLIGIVESSQACPDHQSQETHMPHEMQHGFILSQGDQSGSDSGREFGSDFGSHLVATGHHSRQAEVMGHLVIDDPSEKEIYEKRKSLNTNGQVYFLLQAQNLDLPSLKVGQELTGPIVESTVGDYSPKNIIVKAARFKIDRIILNIENPFFGTP